jgi:hypothetical protein
VARKPEIQYVRFYTDGSAARQLEVQSPRKRKAAYPQKKKQQGYVIYVDPLAVTGILLAAMMLISMLVGSIQLAVAQQQLSDAKAHVTTLRQSNEQLRATYEEGYDLEEVERSALALGMIPVSQAQVLFVEIEEEQVVEEPTFWERMSAKLQDLFA